MATPQASGGITRQRTRTSWRRRARCKTRQNLLWAPDQERLSGKLQRLYPVSFIPATSSPPSTLVSVLLAHVGEQVISGPCECALCTFCHGVMRLFQTTGEALGKSGVQSARSLPRRREPSYHTLAYAIAVRCKYGLGTPVSFQK